MGSLFYHLTVLRTEPIQLENIPSGQSLVFLFSFLYSETLDAENIGCCEDQREKSKPGYFTVLPKNALKKTTQERRD